MTGKAPWGGLYPAAPETNTTPVRNIKRYLLTLLFDASATSNNDYTAQFQREYYGGGCMEGSSVSW